MINIDRIDRHMLMVLQKEGRLSTADLSERVGLSPSPCARRLKRMEDEGLIENFEVNLNKKKVGINLTFFVEVNLSDHQAESIKKFESALTKFEEVINAHVVSGGYDYLLEVVSKDLESYEAFTRKLHIIISLKDIQTHLSVRQVIAKSPLPVYV